MEFRGGGNLKNSPFFESLSNIAVACESTRLGFTLAEVLITLGVIGVIAALTIPTLISKYNETVTIIALKKTYSELAQAIKMSEAVNGDLRDWDWGSNYTQTDVFVKKYILPYLSKNITKCNWQKPCFKEDWRWKNIDGTYRDNPFFLYSRYKYNDKTIVFALTSAPCTSSAATICSDRIRYLEIAVDVNGDKGDSIMGKDVFFFTLFNYTYKTKFAKSGDNYGLQLGTIQSYWGAYNQTYEFILNSCNSEVNGQNCGLAIQKNGWKIPERYPIKF